MVKVSKTKIFVVVCFLLLGVSFDTSRVAAETPQSKAKKKIIIKWGKPVEGIVGAVSLKQKSVEHHVDQPIWINLRTKNTSSKNIWLPQDSMLTSYEFHVVDPHGKVLPFTIYGKERNTRSIVSTRSPTYILKPQSTYHGDSPFWLNRYFDMTLPGTYQVSFKQDISYLNNKKSVTVTVTSNTLKIKVIEPLKSFPESKPEASKIKWGKPVEKIACAMSTNVKKDIFYFKSPIWVNLHTKTPPKLKSLTGEYEISVMAPYEEYRSLLLYTKNKWNSVPLTLYGLQKAKGKDKSTLHITLKPNAKENFVRLHLSRYFDMTMFSDDGYKVSFKRKFKLPKKNKTVTIQSNTLLIKSF